MPTICPAPQFIRAAFASTDPGPPETDPISVERVVALSYDEGYNHHFEGCIPLVVEDDFDNRRGTGLAPAPAFDGYLGLLWDGDSERLAKLTERAVEYRRENVPTQ